MLKVKLERQLCTEEEQALACLKPELGGEACFCLQLSAEKTIISCESCELNFKPWWIDLLQPKLLTRSRLSSRKTEAVAHAVLGSLPEPLVYDATAGLGRDALILQSAGARVWMFERNPVIYLLLYDALIRAQHSSLASQLKHGLPRLMPFGTLVEQAKLLPAPDAIYYDPMFPSRTKSALVKKEMQLFHYLAGADPDTQDYLKQLGTLGSRRLVLKRPQHASREMLSGFSQFSIDGKACRYDCYQPVTADRT
ncbi:MAG: class I SAM-dependent methyltransferase [Succinivibrio sp.]|nr:class I SAM-dependent methyltransferase [Succinivibrio sp.]